MVQKRQGGLLISKVHQLAGRIFTKKLKSYDLSEINSAQGRIMILTPDIINIIYIRR
jgi:hypothetical protein